MDSSSNIDSAQRSEAEEQLIDSAGFNIYVFPPLVTGVTGSPDGGLTKLSAGNLTLYGTNTYTGPTDNFQRDPGPEHTQPA